MPRKLRATVTLVPSFSTGEMRRSISASSAWPFESTYCPPSSCNTATVTCRVTGWIAQCTMTSSPEIDRASIPVVRPRAVCFGTNLSQVRRWAAEPKPILGHSHSWIATSVLIVPLTIFSTAFCCAGRAEQMRPGRISNRTRHVAAARCLAFVIQK